MQLHQLKPIHKAKQKKRIGRGGKRGFTSGAGSKGQKSRAGRKFQPLIRQIVKRYPKLRGHKQELRLEDTAILNLENLEKNFTAGEKVAPAILLEKKIIARIRGRIPTVKILGRGEITKSLTVENCEVSKSAKEKITKAGGEIK